MLLRPLLTGYLLTLVDFTVGIYENISKKYVILEVFQVKSYSQFRDYHKNKKRHNTRNNGRRRGNYE